MQLSPPFQLPQPVGAMATASDGIEVGIIGGSELGETVPVTVLGEVVVEAFVTLVLADVDVRVLAVVVAEACETLVVADVDVETCVVLEAAVVVLEAAVVEVATVVI